MKDLIKLLHEIDDYQIFVPDSVVKYHLERAGCNIDPTDKKIVRNFHSLLWGSKIR